MISLEHAIATGNNEEKVVSAKWATVKEKVVSAKWATVKEKVVSAKLATVKKKLYQQNRQQ